MNQSRKNKKPTPFREVEKDFWLAGCLDEDDLRRAGDEGFDSIINILPEDDELCCVSDEQAKQITETQGLSYRHMPVYGHQLNNEFFARAFAYLISEVPGRKLVYCRSGMRVAFLWGMIRAADLGVDEVLDRTLDVGFDLMVIEDDLINMASKPSLLNDTSKAA